ncbi:MAG: MSCRAMM family protein, partial [Thermoplasmata archaeon]
PWVSGHAVLRPWAEVSVNVSGTIDVVAFAPGAHAQGCDRNGANCGPAGPVDPEGAFNVSAPAGATDTVSIVGIFGGGSGSVAGGFDPNSSHRNVSGNWTNLSVPIGLPIFASIEGVVWDGSTRNSTGVPQLPARFASLSFTVTGTASGTIAVTAGGGGAYAVLLPSNAPPSTTYLKVSMNGYYYPWSYTYRHALAPGGNVTFPSVNLSRWGWVETRAVDRTSNLPTPFLSITASFDDLANQTTWTSSGTTNLAGWVNLSAPIGREVVVQAGPANDLNSTTITVEVNASRTTYVNLTGSIAGWVGNLSVPPWGWVRSVDVNASFVPDLPTVVDRSNLRPIPSANLQVCSTAMQCGQAPQTNAVGQFVTDAPIGPSDSLTIRHPGYLANQTLLNVRSGATIILPAETTGSRGVRLTGDGVLAGVVVGAPGDRPIAGATVTVCPLASSGSGASCSSSVTNSTGVYWVIAPPELDAISVTATNFVANSSAAHPCSDCWEWVGAIRLEGYAYVSGLVRGLPSGLPVAGAWVSVCRSLGTPLPVCGYTATTNATGEFEVAAPAGTYTLEANASFFNTTYLAIGLVPGQHVDVGTILLQEFGWIAGEIRSSTTFAPVQGAVVYACPAWSGGSCRTSQNTSADGRFLASGPAGPYVVAVVAPAYADRYVASIVVSGVTTIIPPILIDPIGTGLTYRVSGRAVLASDPSIGVPGAVAAALLNGSPAASTLTAANGAFRLDVPWGTYNLSVVASGYAPTVLSLRVEGPIAGLVVQLGVMTYAVHGTVTDGLTHQPLAGVAIGYEGMTLAVTGPDGLYTVDLPNGTARLSAIYAGAGAIAYPSVAFTIEVNGAGQTHDVALEPPMTTIYGLVVDRSTGLGIAGASVRETGRSTDGLPVDVSLVTDAAGSFTVVVPQGTYTTNVSSFGYARSLSVPLVASAPAYALTVELEPLVGATTSVPSGTLGLLGIMSVVVVALGAMALVVVLITRRPPSHGAVRTFAPSVRYGAPLGLPTEAEK